MMQPAHKNSGFAIVELVMTALIIVIIASIVVPHFFNSHALQSRGFADQVQSSLRYAQKIALAQHRFVCVAFTSSSIALTTGATNACGSPLTPPAGSSSHVVNAPDGVNFSTVPSDFFFDASGRPSANQTITISGVTPPIAVEAETVHVQQ